MEKLVTLLLFLLSFTFNLNGTGTNSAEIKVLQSTLSETVLKIHFPEAIRCENKDNSFCVGRLEVFKKDNFPSLPYVSRIIAISDRGSFTGEVETKDEDSIQIRDPFPFFKTYPEKLLYLDTPQILRDYRILRFQFFPVQYLPDKNIAIIKRDVIIRIRRTGTVGKNEKRFNRKSISQSFYNIYKNSILNFESVKRFPSDTILYVIITPDAYYDYMLPFKKWKEETGIITKMVKFSEIGGSPTYYDIRNYILNLYNNQPHPPDYFLAVGDAGIFPVRYTYDYVYGGTYADDNYYVALDTTNDIFPDIFGGRLPIQNSFHLQTMINKIINYESDPFMAETTWYNRAIMIASDEYPTQPAIKRRIRLLFLKNGYNYVDSVYADNYSNVYTMRNDITNALNAGRGFLNYRGPGWYWGWWSPYLGDIYGIPQVQALNNGRRLPVVTSIGCGVAKFDEGNCFGEQWLRNGTPTSEKGAIGFFGPTWVTHTRHNNKLDKGIYQGIFTEGVTTFGEAGVR